MLLGAASVRILTSGLSPGAGPSCQVHHNHLGRAIKLCVVQLWESEPAWLRFDFICLWLETLENRDLLEQSGHRGDAVSASGM